MRRLAERIRAVPDFPEAGVVFRDITPLLADPEALRLAARHLAEPFAGERIDAVVGAEARGFIFGSLVARQLRTGFVPLRKAGKLPRETLAVRYDLEYGQAVLEAHVDAVSAGDRVLLVDDVLATGGTSAAGCALVEQLGGEVAACAFVIELSALAGRARLAGHRVHTLLRY